MTVRKNLAVITDFFNYKLLTINFSRTYFIAFSYDNRTHPNYRLKFKVHNKYFEISLIKKK